MPPARQPRRSKQARTTPTKRRRGRAHVATTDAKKAPPPVNTKGLACLPDELYLEILSYLPEFPVPNFGRPSIGSKEYYDYNSRRLALDALSNTCRALRRVCVLYQWQQLEVYEYMELAKGQGRLPSIEYKYLAGKSISGSKAYATKLIRQLEIVTIREPSLAEFVNVLDVFITDYCARNVIRELARCMALMPNLHTVQIHFDRRCSFTHGKRNFIYDSFAPYSYPQIRTISFLGDGLPLLMRCPMVKRIYMTRDYSTTCHIPQLQPYFQRAGFVKSRSEFWIGLFCTGRPKAETKGLTGAMPNSNEKSIDVRDLGTAGGWPEDDGQ